MNNVEKKLIQDFENWRAQENKVETNREAIYKDTEEFMQTRFQIEPSKGKKEQGEQPISILDILDTMIAPDADASLAANSVRQNVMACQKSTANRDSDPCEYSCSNPNFNISGSKCFHVSPTLLNYDAAKTACQDMGAQLATISGSTENQLVHNFMILQEGETAAWVGLNDIDNEGTYVSPLHQTLIFGFNQGNRSVHFKFLIPLS